MPNKPTPPPAPKPAGLESRQAAWKESIRMLPLEHDALVAEAEQRQALLESLSASAQKAGLDLKGITARRAAAFEKIVASLKPFLAKPKEVKK